MSRCKNCNMEILDNTVQCPFCRFVLEQDNSGKKNMYPNVTVRAKKIRLAENIVLFTSVVAAATCGMINYVVDSDVMWSLIVFLALFYANAVLRLAVVGKSGYMFKIISLIIMAIVVLVGIDYLVGYHGWALNYVLPSGILAMDVVILILMIVNHRNWQSYIMVQIFMILLSLIPLFLYFNDLIQHVVLVYIAIFASVFLFLGTMIIGDQRAKNELRRRFYL